MHLINQLFLIFNKQITIIRVKKHIYWIVKYMIMLFTYMLIKFDYFLNKIRFKNVVPREVGHKWYITFKDTIISIQPSKCSWIYLSWQKNVDFFFYYLSDIWITHYKYLLTFTVNSLYRKTRTKTLLFVWMNSTVWTMSKRPGFRREE